MIESRFSVFSGSVRLLVAAIIGLMLIAALTLIPAGSAEAKYKQPTCGKFVKKVKQSKGAAKRAAKRRLKNCETTRKVYNRVKDSRFTGTRADGVTEDIVLCANGTVADDPDSEFGQTFRGGWRIDVAKTKGRFFQAGFAAKIDGGERVGALKFDRSGWQVGIYGLDGLTDFGPAERTDARELCRTL